MVTIKCVRGPIVVGYKFMQAGEQREVTEATAAEAKAKYGDAVWLPGEPEQIPDAAEQPTDGVLTSSHAPDEDLLVIASDVKIQDEVTVLETNPGGAIESAEIIAEPNEAQDADSLRDVEEPAAKRGSRAQRNTKR